MTARPHADAAARMLSAGAPVLMLDTCMILDIVRTPSRATVGARSRRFWSLSIIKRCKILALLSSEWVKPHVD